MALNFCDPCKVRNKQTNGIKLCTNCKEYLCAECMDIHMAMKFTKNHKLTDVEKSHKAPESGAAHKTSDGGKGNKPTDNAKRNSVTETEKGQKTGEIYKAAPKENSTNPYCIKHQNNPLEFFCIEHDVLSCKDCWADQHKKCEKLTIDAMAKGFKKSDSFYDSVEQLDILIQTLNAFLQDRTINAENLEYEDRLIKKEIKQTKEHLQRQIEDLEKSLIVTLEDLKSKCVLKCREAIEEALDILRIAEEQRIALDVVKQHGSELEAFLSCYSLKGDLSDILNKVSQLTNSTKYMSLSYEGSTSADNVKSLGALDTIESQGKISFIPGKQRPFQIQNARSQKISSFEFQHDSDFQKVLRQKIQIFGVAITHDNVLLLSDNASSQIIVADENGHYQASIKTSYKPWDIITLPDTHIAVMSAENDDFKYFLDISRRKETDKKKIKDSAHGGLSATKDYIVVGAKGKIYLLDHKGSIIKEVNVDVSETVWYVSASKQGNIYFTDGNSNILHCIKYNGETIFDYESSSLVLPGKSVIDELGYIYVVGWYSDNVHRLTPDGSFDEAILKRNDGIKGPYTLCFNKDCTKLFVTKNNGTTISVFKAER